MSKLANVRDVSVQCGSSKEIDAFDADGNPIKYKIIAGPPPDRGGESDHPSPWPLSVPPATQHGGTLAGFQVVDTRAGGPFTSEADFFVSQDFAPDLEIGQRRQAVVWGVGNVTGGRVTLDLPEGYQHRDGDNMTFVIGLD
jgi:hypothetical protein